MYFLFLRGEYLLMDNKAFKVKKFYFLLFAFLIRFPGFALVNGDVQVLMYLTEYTIRFGYPYVKGLPLYASYWSEHNPLYMYVCHPPLTFYLYAPVVAIIEYASVIFTIGLFMLSLNVFWNYLERNNKNPLIPSLLYATFPLFLIESMTSISLNILLISVLMVGIVNYLEYERGKSRNNLMKAVISFSIAPIIEYSAILFLFFFSIYFLHREIHFLHRERKNAIILLIVIWFPFLLWNIFAGFPIFHSYAFHYTKEHHFDDNLPYKEAVREYYDQHENAVLPYYLMDNEFFAFINFAIFLNGNLLLIGNGRRKWNLIILLSILTQLLLLTYHAVIGYQSHPLANFARYIIPSAFLIVPFSLRTRFNGKWKLIALIVLAINLLFLLSLIINGGFRWVTLDWRFAGN